MSVAFRLPHRKTAGYFHKNNGLPGTEQADIFKIKSHGYE